jgi:hypothetical protein
MGIFSQKVAEVAKREFRGKQKGYGRLRSVWF